MTTEYTVSKFFAIISRMKYIERWGLMRNTIKENLSEHCLETAFIAHVLALYRNVRFGGGSCKMDASPSGTYSSE